MTFDNWLLYLLTCCGISLVPGPNAMLVLTHAALHGRPRTLYTISGGVLGFMVITALCALGLAVLVQASTVAFTLLKVGGGLYLVWLGIKLWRAAPPVLEAGTRGRGSGWSLFRQGLLSALANPKALLLYAAFIPPFLEPGRNALLQATVIALTYAAVEFAVEFLVASAAHSVRPWLARVGKAFNRVCGGAFVAFGLVVPLG